MKTEDHNKYLSAIQKIEEPFGPKRLELGYSDEILYTKPMPFDIFTDVYQYRIHFDNPFSEPENYYKLYTIYGHALELLDDFEEEETTIKEIRREVIKTIISDKMGNEYLAVQNESQFRDSIYDFYFRDQTVSQTEQYEIFKSINHLIHELLMQLDICNSIISQMSEIRNNPKVKFFSTDLEEDQLIKIKELLVKREYLKECSNDNFLYYFGNHLKHKEEPLKWNKRNQSLANIMHMICNNKCERRPAIRYAFDNDSFNTNHKGTADNYTDNDTNEIENAIKDIISTKVANP